MSNTGFSNDGSFMEQFMKKYAKPKADVEKPSEEERKKEEEAARNKAEKEKEALRLQKEREEFEKEKKKQKDLVDKLIAQQKKQQEIPEVAKTIPKARKQPFQSNSTPSPSKKRSVPPPRSKPAMPVSKRQKTTVFLPRHRPRIVSTLEPPKPPPFPIKAHIDEFAQLVVDEGIQLEDRVKEANAKLPNPKFDFLVDKESETYRYYEYKKEQLCEEQGIVLAKNLEESESVRALNATVEVVSAKYKELEKVLEEEDKSFKKSTETYEEYYESQDMPSNENDGEFVQKLASHVRGNGEIFVEKKENLLASASKGAMLLKNMGWTEGTGLGAKQSGRLDPVIANVRLTTAGLGAGEDDSDGSAEKDIFAEYQKLMREKHRNRPMPPRRQ